LTVTLIVTLAEPCLHFVFLGFGHKVQNSEIRSSNSGVDNVVQQSV